jgi:hypothetical protein
VSGKKYIGSSNNLYRRFCEHFLHDKFRNIRIREDIEKFGICKFEFNIIFTENYLKEESLLLVSLIKDFKYNKRFSHHILGDKVIYATSISGEYKKFLSLKEVLDFYKNRNIKNKINKSSTGKLVFLSECP